MGWINSSNEYNGGDQQPGEIEVPDRPSADYMWNGSEWVLKPPAVPDEVTMAQAQQALLASGLLDLVDTKIATLSRAAQIDWKTRPTVRRDNTWVLEVKAQLGWTDAQTDSLFILAKTF